MITKQVWKIGDCVKLIKELPDGCINLILTDPPYGVTDEIWDILPNWQGLAPEIKRVCKKSAQLLVFGMQPTFSEMICTLKKDFVFKDEIIWYYKDGGAGNTKGTGLKNVHQNIAWFSISSDDFFIDINSIRISYQPNERNNYPVKRGTRIWTPNPLGAYPINIMEYPKHKELKNGKTQFHNHYTIKPLPLIENLIKGFSKEGDVVLDLYAGTGTTLKGCRNTSRNGIGFELLEMHEPLIKERLKMDAPSLETWCSGQDVA